MAGGSADGAAIIRLLNERYQLNMDYEAKQKAALYVGADVFFCLMNKPALVKGIGEELEPFSFPWPFYVLLVKPKDGVSTKEAFDLMDVKTCPHFSISPFFANVHGSESVIYLLAASTNV